MLYILGYCIDTSFMCIRCRLIWLWLANRSHLLCIATPCSLTRPMSDYSHRLIHPPVTDTCKEGPAAGVRRPASTRSRGGFTSS